MSDEADRQARECAWQQDRQWFLDHEAELAVQYPYKVVAVYRQQVVAAEATRDDALAAVLNAVGYVSVVVGRPGDRSVGCRGPGFGQAPVATVE